MKHINYLLICLPLLFFGLFLFTNNVLANSYQEGVSLSILSAQSGSTYINENGFSSFANTSSYSYNFGYCNPNPGPCSTAYKGWSNWNSAYSANGYNYAGDESWYSTITNCSNPILGDWNNQSNYGPWSFSVGTGSGSGYYGPGYYMFAVDYPSGAGTGYNYAYWDSFINPGYYGAKQSAYIPLLITSAGQTVNLNMNWDIGYLQLDGCLNSDLLFQVAYSPILHDGECGSNNGTWAVGSTSFGAGSFCKTYTASGHPLPSTFPTNSNPTVVWTCPGSLGGSDMGCAAKLKVNGACGTATNGHFYTKPTETSLCSTGASSAVSGTGTASDPWRWGCNGINGGTNVTTCSANIKINGTCGTYTNGQTLSAKPTGDNNLCDFGTAINFVDNGTSWTWKCASNLGGVSSSQCSANLGTPTTVTDGVCGISAKVYSSGSSYHGATCQTSASPIFVSGTILNTTNPVINWICPSPDGGANSPVCTAFLGISGVCGGNNPQKKYAVGDTFPGSDGYCATGTVALPTIKYYYRVSAINSTGTGTASDPANATTPSQ